MSKLLHELKEFRQKCAYLENKLDTTGTELLHLREANIMAHDDITHLRASVSLPMCMSVRVYVCACMYVCVRVNVIVYTVCCECYSC